MWCVSRLASVWLMLISTTEREPARRLSVGQYTPI